LTEGSDRHGLEHQQPVTLTEAGGNIQIRWETLLLIEGCINIQAVQLGNAALRPGSTVDLLPEPLPVFAHGLHCPQWLRVRGGLD